MKRFDNVSLLFMDEFDAYYHFALSARIIELIKKHRNLQAIFTTHNTFLMSNRILRPDCYFMMEGGRLKSYIERRMEGNCAKDTIWRRSIAMAV